MLEWNIQSRSHSCQRCSVKFNEGQPFHTLLHDSRFGFERRDLCVPCWKEQNAIPVEHRKYNSQWQSIYVPPPAVAPDAIQKESAETLLRKLMELHDSKYTATCYILAVMLERKRILKIKAQIREGGRRIFVYEQPRTGDVFPIPDPDLQLDQLETVQHDVARLLEHGIPISGEPQEEPFNPPSELTSLSPSKA